VIYGSVVSDELTADDSVFLRVEVEKFEGLGFSGLNGQINFSG